MKILWLGTVVNKETEKKIKAISPAANRWQLNFIKALEHNDVYVINISHIIESSWPRGRFFINSVTSRVKNMRQLTVNYLNFYFLREISIALNTILEISRHKKEEYDYIFTYNEALRNKIVALYFRLVFKKPWISILADGKTGGKADLVIFLSENYYKRFQKDKYLLEGGIEDAPEKKNSPSNEKYFLYAGSMTEITGIVNFIELYLSLDIENKIHLYGKPTNEVVRLANNNSKIVLKGFVADNELAEACSNAYAFINPRGEGGDADNTFPSKLLLYLKYGKPIISYKSSSIPSKFEDILFYYRTEEELKKIVNDLKNMDRVLFEKKIFDFQRMNTWDFLVKQLINRLKADRK
jgi:glycosyltransferase involved in cell wall biosynthesis